VEIDRVSLGVVYLDPLVSFEGRAVADRVRMHFADHQSWVVRRLSGLALSDKSKQEDGDGQGHEGARKRQ